MAVRRLQAPWLQPQHVTGATKTRIAPRNDRTSYVDSRYTAQHSASPCPPPPTCSSTRAASCLGVSVGYTGTTRCARMGPVSYSASTKCTVGPEYLQTDMCTASSSPAPCVSTTCGGCHPAIQRALAHGLPDPPSVHACKLLSAQLLPGKRHRPLLPGLPVPAAETVLITHLAPDASTAVCTRSP